MGYSSVAYLLGHFILNTLFKKTVIEHKIKQLYCVALVRFAFAVIGPLIAIIYVFELNDHFEYMREKYISFSELFVFIGGSLIINIK
jgi:hypothetical protein